MNAISRCARPLIIPGFWAPAECARVRRAMDAGSAAAAEVDVEEYHVDDVARRTTEIEVEAATLQFVEAALASVRPLIARHFAVPLIGNEGASFLRYRTGDFYRAHRDSLGAESPFVRRFTVVVFLGSARQAACGTGEYSGGTLRLHGPFADGPGDIPIDVLPERGTLVAFPSDTLHEVLPVRAGVRDVVADRLY